MVCRGGLVNIYSGWLPGCAALTPGKGEGEGACVPHQGGGLAWGRGEVGVHVCVILIRGPLPWLSPELGPQSAPAARRTRPPCLHDEHSQITLQSLPTHSPPDAFTVPLPCGHTGDQCCTLVASHPLTMPHSIWDRAWHGSNRSALSSLTTVLLDDRPY